MQMAVVGNKPLRKVVATMEKPSQYFAVGDVFRYAPISDPDNDMILEVVERYNPHYCGLHCDLCRYCLEETDMVGGKWFVPVCNANERRDRKSVVFTQIA